RAHAEPRRLHDRPGCERRREGGGDVRRRGPHDPHRAAGRGTHPHPAGQDRRPLRPLSERLWAEAPGRTPVSRSIIPDLKKNVVWFLTGSQDLYGEETLRQVAEQSRGVVEQLQAASDIPVTIEWKPVLKSSDAIRRAMIDANADDDVVGVITWM